MINLDPSVNKVLKLMDSQVKTEIDIYIKKHLGLMTLKTYATLVFDIKKNHLYGSNLDNWMPAF